MKGHKLINELYFKYFKLDFTVELIYDSPMSTNINNCMANSNQKVRKKNLKQTPDINYPVLTLNYVNSLIIATIYIYVIFLYNCYF